MLTAGTMITRVTVTELFSYVIGLDVAVTIYGQGGKKSYKIISWLSEQFQFVN